MTIRIRLHGTWTRIRERNTLVAQCEIYKYSNCLAVYQEIVLQRLMITVGKERCAATILFLYNMVYPQRCIKL